MDGMRMWDWCADQHQIWIWMGLQVVAWSAVAWSGGLVSPMSRLLFIRSAMSSGLLRFKGPFRSAAEVVGEYWAPEASWRRASSFANMVGKSA